jgi:hypothetical protein
VRAWLEAVARRRAAWLAPAAIAAVGAAIAWAFAATVLRQTRPLAFPLDDSYAYLVHARQLGRGQLAGAVGLWPIVLAPLWLVGARGQALVWASFALSAALYVATALGVARIVRTIAGGVAGVVAALLLLGVAAFASSALAGTEAAIASAVLVAIACRLLAAPPTGPPAKRLAVALAAATLAGPALAMIAIAIVAVAVIQRVRQRDRRAALRWLAPLVVPVAWCGAHHALALPSALRGSDVAATGLGHLLRAVFWDATSPLVWPRIVALLWLAGAVRVALWARRAQRGLAGVVIVVAPAVVMLGAAAAGRWSADSGRFLAPALPFVMIGAGCALGVTGRRRCATIAAAIVLVGFAWFAVPGAIAEARRFAQAATDLDVELVAAGDHVHRHRPDAIGMAEQPGAIAYAADVPVVALPASEGPGVVFEQLERLAPAQRPTWFAIDPAGPSAPAIAELSGDSGFRAALGPALVPRRGALPASVEIFAARWDHVGTGERPLVDHAGWAIVDRIDLADRDSEAAHGWAGALGAVAGAPPAQRSMIGREVGAQGLILDGGRTIRGGERFTLALDPARPARLVLRTGGARSLGAQDPAGPSVDHAAQVRLLDAAGRELAAVTVPAPDGRFVELTFALPAGASRVLHTEASSAYRAFHWFALQPE